MKSKPVPPPGPAALTSDHWDVPIRVRLVPYVAFGQWMDEELEKLVVRWIDRAAPAAQRVRR